MKNPVIWKKNFMCVPDLIDKRTKKFGPEIQMVIFAQ